MALLLSLAPENFTNAANVGFPQYLASRAGGSRRSAWAFDPTVSERMRSYSLSMPPFTGALTLTVVFDIAATTGDVVFRAQVEAVTPSDAINMSTTDSFAAVNSSGAVSVPVATFNPKLFAITLTNNDSVAALDTVIITLDRDATNGSDTAAGDCFITQVYLSDAS